MSKRPPLKEIAAMTGLSLSTISRAFSGSENISYSTKKKIEHAVNEYYGNLNNPQSGKIGLIIPDIQNQFFPLLLLGIENVASSSNYTLLLSNSNGSSKQEDKLLQQMIDLGVDGVIFVSSGSASDFVNQIIDSKIIPLVFLDRDPGLSNINYVTTENFNGMYQATRYLLTLQHSNILFLGGTENTSTNKERLEGFTRAMHDAGCEVSERNIVYADFDFRKGYEVIKNMLDSQEFDYTAVLAANDLMALGAIKALNEKHISIPEDISVIGYDDIPVAEFVGLTTVHQPFSDMGRRAMYQLLALIQDSSFLPNKIVLPTSIVFRNSCALPSSFKRP